MSISEIRDVHIPSIDNLLKKDERFYKDIGEKVFSTYYWVSEGAKKDNDDERMKRNWYDAVKKVDDHWKNKINTNALSGLRKEADKVSDKELMIWLDDLVCAQAYIIWRSGGCKEDNDPARKENDYYEAKRYIAFLIADDFLKHYRENNSEDCFKHLRYEYIYYLISLSVEDYIKISAYLQWGNEKDWMPVSDKKIIDKYYFDVLQNLEFTHYPCKKKNISQCLNLIDMEAKDYINKNYKIDKLNKVINAKKNALQRIKAQVGIHEIEEYTKLFYTLLHDIFNQNIKLNTQNAANLIKLMRRFNYIPNMFEFILHCFICCASGVDDREFLT